MDTPIERDALPEPIRRAVGDRLLERIALGESGADVFRCDARGRSQLYLKTLPLGAGRSLRAERDRLRWVAGRFPAPEVVAWSATPTREYLVTAGLPGVPASDLISAPDAKRTARLFGEALRRLHSIPVLDCPFDAGIDAMLAEARCNIDRHGIVEDDFDGGRIGRSAESLLAEACRTRPRDCAGVFIHGDAYPQNVLVEADTISGFIDWGCAGVGDPWRDLALATILIEERSGRGVAAELLAAYGVDEPDADRCAWWRLMDEFC